MADERKELEAIAPSQLPLLDLGEFMRQQFEAATVFTQAKNPADLGAVWLLLMADWATQHNLLHEVIKYVRGNETSPFVRTADGTRDLKVSIFDDKLNSWKKLVKLPEATLAQKTALDNVLRVRKTFPGIQRMNLGAESSAINSLVNKLRAPGLVTSVTTLGLTEELNSLDASQKEFERLFDFRLNDLVAKQEESPTGTAMRGDLEWEYSLVMKYVLVMASKYPQSDWTTLFETFNHVRKNYGSLLSRGQNAPAAEVEEPVLSIN